MYLKCEGVPQRVIVIIHLSIRLDSLSILYLCICASVYVYINMVISIFVFIHLSDTVESLEICGHWKQGPLERKKSWTFRLIEMKYRETPKSTSLKWMEIAISNHFLLYIYIYRTELVHHPIDSQMDGYQVPGTDIYIYMCVCVYIYISHVCSIHRFKFFIHSVHPFQSVPSNKQEERSSQLTLGAKSGPWRAMALPKIINNFQYLKWCYCTLQSCFGVGIS